MMNIDWSDINLNFFIINIVKLIYYFN
jgi:hypothetical protein